MNPAAIARKANKKISQYGQRMEFVRETEGPTNPETMHWIRAETPIGEKEAWDVI